MPEPLFVDRYIAAARPFAQPVLRHLRALVTAVSPDICEEKKWSVAAFTYKRTIICMMGAFKDHVTFGFWYGKAVTGGTGVENAAMGSFGRIVSLSDLPGDADLVAMVRTSMELIDKGVKPPQFKEKRPPKPEGQTPPPLADALVTNPAAQQIWDTFTPAQRREYSEWITDAKRDETRAKRVAEAVGWIAEGKRRNWKYENC